MSLQRLFQHKICSSTLSYTISKFATGQLMANKTHILGIPMIYYSTDYVFDGDSSEPYQEKSITSPIGVYGKSKLQGEILLVKITRNM